MALAWFARVWSVARVTRRSRSLGLCLGHGLDLGIEHALTERERVRIIVRSLELDVVGRPILPCRRRRRRGLAQLLPRHEDALSEILDASFRVMESAPGLALRYQVESEQEIRVVEVDSAKQFEQQVPEAGRGILAVLRLRVLEDG